MPNPSPSLGSRARRLGLVLLAILLIALPNFAGTHRLNDAFHHGEYFAAAVYFATAGSLQFFPLTLHGALDVLPAAAARSLWGSDAYFLPTLGIYKLLSFLAAGLLILISMHLTRGKPFRTALVVAVAVVAARVVGYRDLMLLLTLYLFLQTRSSRDPRTSLVLQCLLGISAGFGLFWSYDRGLAGAVGLGVAVLVALVTNRKYAVSLIAFVMTVAAVSLSHEMFSLPNYIGTVLFLQETSSQWAFGWQPIPTVLSAFSAGMCLAVVALMGLKLRTSRWSAEHLPEALAFVILSLFFLKFATNRIDVGRTAWGLWLPMLAALYVLGTQVPRHLTVKLAAVLLFLVALGLSAYFGEFGLALVAGIVSFVALHRQWEHPSQIAVRTLRVAGLAVAGLALYSGGSLKDVAVGRYAWIGSLANPPPNALSAPASVRWAADRLRDHGVLCVFDLSNHGLINGLVDRPSCSRFTYPVYAGPQHEQELIRDLRSTSPGAIVYSSTHPSYAIDGRSMPQRFPALDAFVLSEYPVQECSPEYCIRYRRP